MRCLESDVFHLEPCFFISDFTPLNSFIVFPTSFIASHIGYTRSRTKISNRAVTSSIHRSTTIEHEKRPEEEMYIYMREWEKF